MIRAGKDLVIPTVAAGRYSSTRVAATGASGSSVGGKINYRVRRGDTLSHIARHYSTSPSAIAAVNDMRTNDVLSIGRRLTVVPGARSVSQARQIASGGAQVVARNSAGDRVHTVRRGDTLWEIAGLYDTTVTRLCHLNRISKSATLYPGTRLTVTD
jgi:membrane-bound lytic murein transglycosylase D